MIFEKKISIDGVAVIIASIGLVVWLTTQGNTIASHTKELDAQATQLQEIQQTEQQLKENLAVLTAIQNVLAKQQPTTTVIK